MNEMKPAVACAVTAIGFASVLSAGCGDAGGDCTDGAEGCACVEKECLGDLVCGSDDTCVDPNGGSSGNASTGTTGSSSSGGSRTGETDPTDTEGDRCEGNEPPEIVDVNVQGEAVAASDDNVRVTITVSDPDGLDDITQARIELPDGSTLKAMGQTSQDGFAAEIDWFYDVYYYGISDEIPLDTLIEFQIAVDDSGCNTTRRALPLTVCGGDGDSLCEGECRDTQSNDASCGSCDNACGQGEYCDYGTCTEDYASVPGDPPEADTSPRPIDIPTRAMSLSFGVATPQAQTVDVEPFAL